jgi:hypothetical protein
MYLRVVWFVGLMSVVVLDNVHIEDRVVIRNVVAAIEALKLEKILLSWTVDVVQGGYTVNAYINDSVDCELSKAELDIIHDVNPLRVLSSSVVRMGGKMRIKVRVSDRNEPIMLTETQIVTVRKRARWSVG